MNNITRHQRTITASQTQICFWKTISFIFQWRCSFSALFCFEGVWICRSFLPILLIRFLLSAHFKCFFSKYTRKLRRSGYILTLFYISTHGIVVSGLYEILNSNYWMHCVYDKEVVKQNSKHICLHRVTYDAERHWSYLLNLLQHLMRLLHTLRVLKLT